MLKISGKKVISPRCEITRSIQSGTVLFVMIACDFVCQNAMPSSYPRNSVLKVLPSCFVVNFSGFRKITTILFFFFFGTPWV